MRLYVTIYPMKKFFNNYHLWWLIVLPMVFFLATSYYNFATQDQGFVKWISPDETANYQMAKTFAESGQLMLLEKYNPLVDGIIAPRSLLSDGSLLKPVSFLGLPLLYGTLAKVFGIGVLPFLTPFFAALGLILFYLIVKRLFDRAVALIAFTLLAGFPVYLYYSVHSFFHNVLFMVAVMSALYFSIVAADWPTFRRADSTAASWQIYGSWILAALAGASFGLAVSVRTSELLWLLPLFLLLWLFNIKRFGFWKLLLFVYFAGLAYFPVMYQNDILYGAPFSSGYPSMDASVGEIIGSSGSLVTGAMVKYDWTLIKNSFNKLYRAFFHFGFMPEYSLKMFYRYVYEMFNWLSLLAGAGFIIFAFGFFKRRKSDLIYLLSLLLLSAILIFYYGSWKFFDNPDKSAYTIGNSYTRYWLPIYLGGLPLAALAIKQLSRLAIKRAWRNLTAIGLTAILLGVAIQFTLFGSDEGLVPSFYRQQAARAEYERVIALTEEDSVLITRYADKLFFPERRVIVGLFNDPAMNSRYAILARRLPVYYYNFSFPERDLAYLNADPLKKVNLRIEKIAQITDVFTLYRLWPIDSP